MKDSLIIPRHKFIGWKKFNNDGEWQLKVQPAEKKDEPAYVQLSSRLWRFIQTVAKHSEELRLAITKAECASVLDDLAPRIRITIEQSEEAINTLYPDRFIEP